MTAVIVTVGASTITVAVDHVVHVVPVGIELLADGELHHDPPRPEELTNAIGFVTDHLDDLIRELPAMVGLEMHLHGPVIEAVAGVEVGAAPDLPFVLSRDAAEDVFRTLATESAGDRARNPGLLREHVAVVVSGCCIVVALMRRLQLDRVTIGATR